MVTTTIEQPVDDFLIAQPGQPIVNITPFTARQKVNGYVGYHISHMMGGEEPSLCYSRGRLVWRVPIILTSPYKGKLGIVGHLDVNARTGQIMVPPTFAEEIQANASKLVTPFPPSSTE